MKGKKEADQDRAIRYMGMRYMGIVRYMGIRNIAFRAQNWFVVVFFCFLYESVKVPITFLFSQWMSSLYFQNFGVVSDVAYMMSSFLPDRFSTVRVPLHLGQLQEMCMMIFKLTHHVFIEVVITVPDEELMVYFHLFPADGLFHFLFVCLF